MAKAKGNEERAGKKLWDPTIKKDAAFFLNYLKPHYGVFVPALVALAVSAVMTLGFVHYLSALISPALNGKTGAELMTEAMEHGFSKSAARSAELPGLEETIENYLSARHRDGLGRGCVLAALSCEMPRQTRSVRKTFTAGLRGALERLRAKLPKGANRAREDDAIALLASMIGGLILARAVDDPQLSDRILTASRKRLLEDFP